MFFVKVINRKNQEDILENRKFNNNYEALMHYNQITTTASLDKNKVIREVNEKLKQEKLTYKDVIIYLLDEEKIIIRFLIN